MSDDCYFYWDGDEVPENERKIYWQCTECNEENGKGAVKWRAEWGYGKTLKCQCGRWINKGNDAIQENKVPPK